MHMNPERISVVFEQKSSPLLILRYSPKCRYNECDFFLDIHVNVLMIWDDSDATLLGAKILTSQPPPSIPKMPWIAIIFLFKPYLSHLKSVNPTISLASLPIPAQRRRGHSFTDCNATPPATSNHLQHLTACII